MVNRFVFVFVAAVLGALVLLVVARSSAAPVSLERTRRFARQQELLVTAANGALVVRTLALTRRWRVLGLTTGLLLGLLWALRDARLNINFATAFLGWFVGAVIAEWRLAGLPVEGARRTASLTRRTTWGYLRPGSVVLVGIVGAALSVLFVAVTVRAGGDREIVTEAFGWLAVAALGIGALWLTLSRVASRPQPGSSLELVAADDALRARSANVLAGSAIVAAGFPAANLLALMGATTPTTQSDWAALSLISMFVTVLVGWLVAVRRSPVRTGAPAAPRTTSGVAP